MNCFEQGEKRTPASLARPKNLQNKVPDGDKKTSKTKTHYTNSSKKR